MKKAIRNFFVFVGVICVLGGIFIATWEAQDFNDQLNAAKYSIVLVVLGFALCLLNGGGENELDG